MGTLTKASVGLLLGAIGELLSYLNLFPGMPTGIVWFILFIPWVIVFGISFCKRPPFGPRPFRWCLITAMVWYALAGILVEVLRFFIHVPPDTHPAGPAAVIAARIITLAGASSFIAFIRICIILRGYETGKTSNTMPE